MTTNEADMLLSSPMLINDHKIPATMKPTASEMFAVATPCSTLDGMNSTDIKVDRTALIGDIAAKKLPI